MSRLTLADHYAAISAALADDIKAVPSLLVAMAADGYGHEAEELRRAMIAASRVVAS